MEKMKYKFNSEFFNDLRDLEIGWYGRAATFSWIRRKSIALAAKFLRWQFERP